jgi:hypothetical protein
MYQRFDSQIHKFMKDLLIRAADRIVALNNENATLREANSNLLQINLSLSNELDEHKATAASTESSISQLAALLDDSKAATIESAFDSPIPGTIETAVESISPIEAIEATFPTVDPALTPVQTDVSVSM